MYKRDLELDRKWSSLMTELQTIVGKRPKDLNGVLFLIGVQELGHGWTECVHPDDLDRLLKIQRTAFEARQEYTLEYRLSRHDGAYRWVYFHGVPRFESDGTFLGYIGAAADITERKQAEEALSRERQFLRQVIDINPNLIFDKDREGRFTLASRAVAEVYGTSVMRSSAIKRSSPVSITCKSI